ncbi:MAG: right-handed parallel beta-helix repeat-containing protein [Phycisphaerae bacterium]|nr:right-handed parallel beta-helix repeat-containing protein [Phycisphaerae bacterium]
MITTRRNWIHETLRLGLAIALLGGCGGSDESRDGTDSTDSATPYLPDIPASFPPTWPEIEYTNTYYVAADASGTGTGQDWTNAFTELPETLERGARYYIAGGAYPSYTFNALEDGERFIGVLKATASEHGTDEGWRESYGSTQAEIAQQLVFRTSYWVFDGMTGSGKDGYGFKVKTPEGSCDARENGIMMPPWASHAPLHFIAIRHTELHGCGREHDYDQAGIYGVGNGYCTNYLISNNYIHNYGHSMHFRSWQDCIIERNYMADGWSSSANHGEAVSEGGSDRLIFRYNYFENFEGTSHLSFAKGDAERADNVELYGNVFFNQDGFGGVGNGAIGVDEERVMNGFMIYNNTFINIQGSRSGVYAGTGNDNIVYNNIFYRCRNPISYADEGGSIDVDYNTFIDCERGVNTTGHNTTRSGNVFVDWANADVRLTESMPGLALDTNDDHIRRDMYGSMRGEDGTWDQGAIELSGP